MGTKLRHIPAEVIRTREATDADGKALGIVEGYSAIYDEPYRVGAGITESIAQRAFDRSIRERSGVIPVFWAHGWKKNNDTPIGHAEVREDATGLHTTAYLYIEDEPRVRSLYNSVVAGAINEWSVGFMPSADGIVVTRTASGVNEEVTDGDLIETSLALKGMNPGTFVSTTRSDELEEDADADADPDGAPAGEPGAEVETPEGGADGADAPGEDEDEADSGSTDGGERAPETRENEPEPRVREGRTHGEIRELLNRHLREQFASAEDAWLWVRDVSDDWVVWEIETGDNIGLYKADYSISDDGVVTIGEPSEVEVTTEYRTVAETRAEDLIARLSNPAIRRELRARSATDG